MPTREYDREFTTTLGNRVRRRVGFDTDRGDVTRFVAQLGYRAIDEQREEIIQALTEELGGDPEDYRAGRRRSVDANE